MDNPAPGSRIRSIRALDMGLAPMRTFAVCSSGNWLAAGHGRLGGRSSRLRSDRARWMRRPLFQRNLIRLGPLDYSGLRGEGSIPVPLPPPAQLGILFSRGVFGQLSPLIAIA
jgi:hypothetical protein